MSSINFRFFIYYAYFRYKKRIFIPRHELTQEQFAKIEHLLPGREGHVGANAKDNPNFLNGLFWILKTGAPWRDLPERYGKWKNVHPRFSRWCVSGVFDKIFQALTDDKAISMLLIDSSIVKAHQHAAGAQKNKTEDEGIGRSHGGLSSKIDCSVNEQGYPLSIYLSGGQVNDSH